MIKEIKKLGYLVVALLVVVLVLPILSATPALATQTTTVFADDFGSSYVSNVEDRNVPGYDDWDDDSDNYGWNCAIRDWGSYPGGHSLCLRHDEELRKYNIDTTGLTNIHLEYTWGQDTENHGDDSDLRVYWRVNGTSSWTTVNSHALSDWTEENPGTHTVNAALGSGAANTHIDIRLRGDTYDDDEEAWVDNVIVSGDPAGPLADLRLEKDVDNPTPFVGDTVTFTITVTNDGPDDTTAVTVTDVVPTGYTYVAASIAGGDSRNDASAPTLTWTIDSLTNGSHEDLTFDATVLASGEYENCAEITASAETDPNSQNDNDCASTDPLPTPTDPNPPLEECCGLDVVLVLDSSGSIGDLDDVRDPAKAFVSALLPGTNSLIGVVEFDTNVVGTPLDLTDNTTEINAAIDAIAGGGSTNWEAGLTEARLMLENGYSDITYSFYSSDRDDTAHPDLIIMVSNGEPTTCGYPTNQSSSTDLEDISNAVIAANAAKGSTGPIRVIYVGVDSSTANGERISGGNVGPPPDVTTDAMLADLPGLDDVEDWGDAIAAQADVCERGTITVIKETIPEGSPQLFEFEGIVSGNISDGQQLTSGYLQPGQYSVTEIVPDCWELDYIEIYAADWDSDNTTMIINLQPGENAVLTFHDLQWGTITVIKETDPPGSSQLFEFTGDAVSGNISDGQQLESGCVVPGLYTVTETVPDCWTLTGIESDALICSENLTTATALVTLQPGEDVTVTFSDMQWGWIIVEKQTDPDNADITFDFAGHRNGTIGDDQQLTGVCLEPYNTYWSQEMDMYLWELMDIQITGDVYPVINGGTESHYDLSERKVYFELDPGEIITATFSNKYFPPPEEEPPAEDHGAPVGIEVYSVNRPALLAPWIALAVVIVAGAILLVRRYRAHR